MAGAATEDFTVYPLDSKDETAIANFFEQITVEGSPPLAGFIHIGSKQEDFSKIDELFQKNEIDTLRMIFLCAKYFVGAPRHENSFFISGVRLDGGLGLLSGENIVQGGLFGLHKSLAIEWEGQILSKAVDLASQLTSEDASKYLLEEIFSTDYAHAEIGRSLEGQRLVPVLVENYIEDDLSDKQITLEPNDTLLVTGGGRGITASCAIHLAKASRCGFILLGRTDLSIDVSWAKGERDQMTLKRLALAKFKEENPDITPKPSEIDQLVKAVLHHAEIMDTLNAIKAVGGRAVYASADVRDAKGLQEVVKKYERELGTITGVIHGAGSIADKKIQRKTTADFDHVFGSKIEGLDACLKALDTSKLKHFIIFSSIAGYFGNAGQSDYSMANEVMNKFAFYFNRHQPSCQTVSINWGPWDGGSMVNESIRNAIKGTELSLIPTEIGAEYFIQQFFAQNNPSQIVINCSDRLIRPKVNI